MASMCSLVSRAGGSDEYQVQAIADNMVQYSRSCMVNKTRVSPFERMHSSMGLSTFSMILLQDGLPGRPCILGEG